MEHAQPQTPPSAKAKPKTGASGARAFSELCMEIRKPTTDEWDRKVASLIVYTNNRNGTLANVGYTQGEAKEKIKEKGQKSRFQVEMGYQSAPSYCAWRARQIVHRLVAVLNKQDEDTDTPTQGEDTDTPTSDKAHERWLKISPYVLIGWVDRVIGWVNSQNPYDTPDGGLTDAWRQNLNFVETSHLTLSPIPWDAFFYSGTFIDPADLLPRGARRPPMTQQTQSSPASFSSLTSSRFQKSPMSTPRRVNLQAGQQMDSNQAHPPSPPSPTPSRRRPGDRRSRGSPDPKSTPSSSLNIPDQDNSRQVKPASSVAGDSAVQLSEPPTGLSSSEVQGETLLSGADGTPQTPIATTNTEDKPPQPPDPRGKSLLTKSLKKLTGAFFNVSSGPERGVPPPQSAAAERVAVSFSTSFTVQKRMPMRTSTSPPESA